MEKRLLILFTRKECMEIEISKPMKVENCNFVKSVQSNPEYYKGQLSYYGATPQVIYEYANKKLEEEWKKTQDTHDSNLPAIEHNKNMRSTLTKIMQEAGIGQEYTEYAFKTSRSRHKTAFKRYAGYFGDLHRTFPVDDGWSEAERQYTSLKKTYDEYKAKADRIELDKVSAQKRADDKRKTDIELVKLILKYQAPDDSDWSDILYILREKDKYLDLAKAMEDVRNDWNDGPDKVEYALGRFTAAGISTDTDKLIKENVGERLDSWQDNQDGRIFRDCTWNYDRIYQLVDEDILTDANKCMEMEQKW